MKNQINVRKSKFIPLDQEKTGKPFSFELNTEELAGKSDDAVMILAAMDQAQYDSWKEGIELCFTIGGEARRRKSTLAPGPMVIPPVETSVVVEEEPNNPPSPMKPLDRPLPGILLHGAASMDEVEQEEEEEASKEKKLNAVKMMGGLAIPMVTPEMLEAKKRISMSAKQKVPFAAPPLDSESTELGSPPLSIVPPPFEETNSVKSVTSPPPSALTVAPQSLENADTSLSNEQTPNNILKDSNHATPPVARKSVTLVADTPIVELTDEQKEVLERRGSRKSFKIPMNLKSLLNSNGLDAAKEEHIAHKEDKKNKEHEAENQVVVPAPSTASAPTTPKNITPSKPRPPRDIKLTVRPTEPQRTGMLEKFDLAQKEEGEDAWVMIEMDLDIATGLVQTYSNIGG